jgi:hypothetical protein
VGPTGRSGARPTLERRRKADSDTDLAKQLWDVSARLTGVNRPE